VPDSIDLSEVGSMSAKLAEFLTAKVQSLKVGNTSMLLSNDQLTITNGPSTTLLTVRSNAIVTGTSNPTFTIQAPEVACSSNLRVTGLIQELGSNLAQRYAASNALSSYCLATTAAGISNIAAYSSNQLPAHRIGLELECCGMGQQRVAVLRTDCIVGEQRRPLREQCAALSQRGCGLELECGSVGQQRCFLHEQRAPILRARHHSHGRERHGDVGEQCRSVCLECAPVLRAEQYSDACERHSIVGEQCRSVCLECAPVLRAEQYSDACERHGIVGEQRGRHRLQYGSIFIQCMYQPRDARIRPRSADHVVQ
jgi:hypothetical protein